MQVRKEERYKCEKLSAKTREYLYKCNYAPSENSIPRVLAFVHLRKNYLELHAMLESMGNNTKDNVKKGVDGFDSTEEASSSDSKPSIAFKRVKEQTYKGASEDVLPDKNNPENMLFTSNSLSKILLLRYTAWMKGLEALQVHNAFLMDYCMLNFSPCDLFSHPILFYDLFACDDNLDG